MATSEQIETLATEWYHKLDNHASTEEYVPLLAGDDFVLQVPEGAFHGFSGFRQWYERALSLFFDESHTVKSVELIADLASGSQVSVVVRWEASAWTPPDAKSRRIVADAYQTWTVRPSASAGQLQILSYAVDRIEYAAGSARL